MANENQDKRTASQKIVDLERALMSTYQAFEAVTRELGLAKEAIKVLGNKVESMAQLSLKGEALSDENLSAQMLENNVTELKGKVAQMVARGMLAPSAEGIDENSFVVVKESNKEGKVVNPRLQFTFNTLPTPELQEKLRGAKAGDTVIVGDDKFQIVIDEVYSIVQAKAPEAAAPEAAQEQASAEAPAAEQA